MILILFLFYFLLGKVKILKQIDSNEDFTITTALLCETEWLSLGVKELFAFSTMQKWSQC